MASLHGPVRGAAPTGAVALALPQAQGRPATLVAVVIIVAAWLGTVLLEATGHAAALHHHALIEGEPGEAAPPLWIAIPIFLVAWQLMIAAMMLPGSIRAMGVVTGSARIGRPVAALAGFLAAYSTVWTAFGFVAFVGDAGLHRLVDATPWLAARPWLIQAATLAIAGTWQLLPLRRRALDACRHPRGRDETPATSAVAGFQAGLAHGVDCLVCSWALMLLMFAAGFANIGWMAILAVVMAYEALGGNGARVGVAAGVGLVALAVIGASGVVVGF